MAVHPAEYRHILVPLDGSGFAEVALPHATAIAHRTGAVLLLVRVVEPLAALLPAEVLHHVDPSYLEAQRQEEAETYLRARTGELREQGVEARYRLVVGTPVARMLLDVMQAEPVDLVVMSTHGYAGLTRWVMGSVARSLLARAPVPILLIRAEETA